MVGGTGTGEARDIAGSIAHIDHVFIRHQAPDIPGDRSRSVAETANEGRGLLQLIRQDRDRAQLADRDFRTVRNHPVHTHQLDDEAIRILEPQDGFPELADRPFHLHTVIERPNQPIADARGGHGKGNLRHLTEADAAWGSILPDQECDEGTG